MGENNVNAALTQSKGQHLVLTHVAATKQAREQSQYLVQMQPHANDEHAIRA